MKTVMKLTAISLLVAAMPLTANAQFARNDNAPIEATADDIVNAGGTTVLTGQVDAPEQEVRGNNGVYVQSTDTFTVTGDVILLQGENVVTGDTLIYNLSTEEARVVGTCKGRRCGSKGRVKILLKNSGGSQS